MAKTNALAEETQKVETAPKAYTAKQVLAARLDTAQRLGYLTPKMQRGFDRMAASSFDTKGDK